LKLTWEANRFTLQFSVSERKSSLQVTSFKVPQLLETSSTEVVLGVVVAFPVVEVGGIVVVFERVKTARVVSKLVALEQVEMVKGPELAGVSSNQTSGESVAQKKTGIGSVRSSVAL